MRFHNGPEKIEGNHIKNKMHIVGVNQAAGYEPVILMFFADGRRPENQIIQHPSIPESGQSNNTGNNDNR
jgi:hypothetical protein